MMGPLCKSEERINGKVVIVTGPNTGVGKATVNELAKRGGQIIMACRSIERCSAAAKDILLDKSIRETQLDMLKLDLSSLSSIRDFVEQFRQKYKRLHILINNAGVMCPSNSTTEDGFESTFGVNHLGHFLLTNLLLDRLLSSAPSRVVTVASDSHYHASIHFDDLMLTQDHNCLYAYAHSKLANVAFTTELARRLNGTGVTTYSLHPGAITTELGRHFNLPDIFKLLLDTVLWPFFKDTYHGAQTTLCCALDPALQQQSGNYYKDCAKTEPNSEAYDERIGARLWKVSEKLVNLNHSPFI